jgi:alkylated DNA repair dioxygenase AlkB
VARGYLTGADALLDELVTSVVWKQGRRQMYERTVDDPRLSRWYHRDATFPHPVLHDAHHSLRARYHVDFGGVALNFYRDGRDSVAAHNDRLHRLVAGAPIALLSLGAARRMLIRAKAPPRRTLQLDMEAGSVLLMSYASQHHFDHGIPKTRAAVGPRISLAFRRLVADAAD